MTQLIKAERKKFYKNLMKIVCADPSVQKGFCWYIEDAATLTGKDILDLHGDYIFEDEFIQEQLPELYRIKPKNKFGYDYWFSCTKEGWQTRINKLYNIIQSM